MESGVSVEGRLGSGVVSVGVLLSAECRYVGSGGECHQYVGSGGECRRSEATITDIIIEISRYSMEISLYSMAMAL